MKRLLVSLGVAAIVSLPAGAQTRRPMTLVDLASLQPPLDPAISPDGQYVAFTLGSVDFATARSVQHIWKQPLAGGAAVQITKGDGENNARWFPDGKTMAFWRNGQMWRVSSDGVDPKPLTKHATSMNTVIAPTPALSPDGAWVYFVAPDAATPAERDRDKERGDVRQPDDDYKQRHLWRASVADGTEQQITTGDRTVLSFRLARDGRHVTVEQAPSPLPIDTYRGEVWIMDADGGNARTLTTNVNFEDTPELSPDNSQVLFLADMNDRFESYYNTTLFIVPAGGGTPKRVLPDTYSFDRASWGMDGKTIIAVINEGVHNEIVRIDVATGAVKPLTNGEHSIPAPPGPVWAGVEPHSGLVAAVFEEATRFGEIWTVSATSDAPARRVTGVFDSLATTFALPRQERIEWKSNDGTTIEGLLFYPIDYQPGKRYPVVVQLHGGPNEADRFGYGPGRLLNYVPVLAAKGYAVLRPNYRGSLGYGNAGLRDIVGHYFNNMHLDVMAGLDHLIAIGIADPDRLAVSGFSAGAHLVNKLITFTPRFKAASSMAGVANWVSLYGQTDSRSNRTVYFGGTPWQANAPIEAYWDNSPIKDVARVTTPTIFFAGANDERVPPAQTQEMYRALRSNGVTTAYYLAPNEAHGWGQLRHAFMKANVELEWFEKYVMNREYVWERLPSDSNPDKIQLPQH